MNYIQNIVFFVCCNNLPEKVQSPCRPIHSVSHLGIKKELVLIPLIFFALFSFLAILLCRSMKLWNAVHIMSSIRRIA